MSGLQRGRSTRGRWADLLFLVGLGLKALDGLVQLALGVPLLVFRPAQVVAAVRLATAGELREDPGDLVAHLLRDGAHSLGASATVVAVYLVVHGAVKLGMVAAIVSGRRRLWPIALAALAGFLVWQCWALAVHPSAGLAVLSAFDALVLVLAWREWRAHRTVREVLLAITPHRHRPDGRFLGPGARS
jgi:uncharacterized membrane protein